MSNPRQPVRPTTMTSSANFAFTGVPQVGDPRFNFSANVNNPGVQPPNNRPWNSLVNQCLPPTPPGFSLPPTNFNSPPPTFNVQPPPTFNIPPPPSFNFPPPPISNRPIFPPSPASLSCNINIPPPGIYPHTTQPGHFATQSEPNCLQNNGPPTVTTTSQPNLNHPSPQRAAGEHNIVSNHFNNRPPSFIRLPPPPSIENMVQSTSGNFIQVPPFGFAEIPKTQSQSMNKETEKECNCDQVWVDNWLSRLNKKCVIKQQDSQLTISTARSLLSVALQALSELKTNLSYLSNNAQINQETWDLRLRKAFKAKEVLNSLLIRLTPSTLTLLKKRLQKVKSKRARLKRQRSLVQEKQEIELQERELLHKQIDSWRNGIQEEVINKKKKEQLKCEADIILSEVRRKLQEAKKVLNKLSLMENLRAGRLENAEKKGQRFPNATNERFEATISKLRDLMNRQIEVYKAEEHALKVMLETEREQEEQDKQQQLQGALDICQNETLHRLFGSPLDESSPLFGFWKYYMQGHTDLETLVQIRHLWDSYLTVQDDPLGSPIPVGWVIPKEPSSTRWESALARRKESS